MKKRWQPMTKSLTLILLIISLGCCSYGNEVWTCTSSKNNITVIAPTSFDDTLKSQMIQDAFLENVINKLNLKHFPFPIIVLINQNGINLPRNNKSIFSTIAYDTIRPLDYVFFYNKMFHDNGTKNSSDTLDYGATNNKNLNEVGLKVVVEFPYSDTLGQFDRIYTLVKYGVENLDKIKKTQGRLFVNSDNGITMISIKTIDTSIINRLPTASLGFDPNNLQKKTYPFIPITLALAIAAGFYLYKKQKHN